MIADYKAIFAKTLKDLFFPNNFTCDVCGKETFGDNLCKDCKNDVPLNNRFTCEKCGRKTGGIGLCLECKDKPPLYKKAVSALVYENGAQVLIHKFKNGGGYLKDYFAELLAEKVAELPEFDCITYVPMLKKDEYKRGYNQGYLLAKSLSDIVGKPVICALEKVRKTKPQKELTFSERQENLRSCFGVCDKELVKGKKILLVDDVLTTGATAEEITGTLLKAGSAEVCLATVASVEYKIVKDGKASEIKPVKRKKHKFFRKV